jgi:ATP-binding cassette subfamily C protein CydC
VRSPLVARRSPQNGGQTGLVNEYPLLRILMLWRSRFGLLWFGVLLSLATLAAGVALMAFSGTAVASVVAGGVFGVAMWLRVAGPSRVVLRYLERLVTQAGTFRALADLRVWFFRGLAERAAGGLGFRQAGDVLSRIVTDVEALDGLYLRILVPLAGALFLVPVAALLAGRVGVSIGVFVALCFATAAFALPWSAYRAAVAAGGDLARAGAGLRIAALDALSGLREVRAFGAEGRMKDLVAARESVLIGAQHSLARHTARANVAAFVCGQAAVLAVLLAAGAHPVLAIATVFLMSAAFEPITGLPRAGVMAGSASAAAARVLDMAEGAHPIPDPARPKAVPAGAGLRFAGVYFAWDNGKDVFTGLTLEVPAGARVAVLGPSGVGKSTLAALALKVAVPQKGHVFLGGVDMTDLAAAEVRRTIAWLGQATHLFNDTIRANLLLGRPEASEAELWDALDRAAIGEVVRNLPERLDTWLGEGGANLSGGQGRRVALARTLLSHAPIIILDEPCAGLDADTERDFLTTLFGQVSGKTVILIAHRLTGAERLDRIFRLSSGHAVAAAA